jgi:2-methylcitrate dehydratase PrpD
MSVTVDSPVAQIAAWGAERPPLPEPVYRAAQRALMDTLGVSLAGSLESAPRALASAALRYATEGPSTVLTTEKRCGPGHAALVNGTAAHALDYDDVSGAYDGHPSACVFPAAFAAAEATAASGDTLLYAFAFGLEVTTALGAALGEENYRRGFHTTSIVGGVGAAVAAGVVYGLDQVSLRRAIGIAASYAGGLKKNFGTMTKPLHAGLAARAGVEAVELAAAGFTADEDVLSGPIGMLAAFGDSGSRLPLPRSTEPEEWLILRPGISIKKYPCCYMLAWALDAALDLKSTGLEPEEIENVEVTVQPGGLSALIHDRPRSGLEGKFSLPYAIAAALVDGEVKLVTFTDEAVNRPLVRSLMEKVRYEQASDPEPEAAKGFSIVERGYARVRVLMRSGEQREKFVRTPRGAPSRPLTQHEINAKFLDTAGAALGRDVALDLLNRLWSLNEVQDVGEVLRDVV